MQSQPQSDLNAELEPYQRNDPRLQPYLSWSDDRLKEYLKTDGDVPRYVLLLGAYAMDNGLTDVVE